MAGLYSRIVLIRMFRKPAAHGACADTYRQQTLGNNALIGRSPLLRLIIERARGPQCLTVGANVLADNAGAVGLTGSLGWRKSIAFHPAVSRVPLLPLLSRAARLASQRWRTEGERTITALWTKHQHCVNLGITTDSRLCLVFFALLPPEPESPGDLRFEDDSDWAGDGTDMIEDMAWTLLQSAGMSVRLRFKARSGLVDGIKWHTRYLQLTMSTLSTLRPLRPHPPTLLRAAL